MNGFSIFCRGSVDLLNIHRIFTIVISDATENGYSTKVIDLYSEELLGYKQAYHLVGDSTDDILAYVCATTS